MANAPQKSHGKQYIAPVIITVLVVAFIAGFIGLLLWVLTLDHVPTAVLFYLALYVAGGLAIIFGVVYCLRQRIKEIQGGESDEASHY